VRLAAARPLLARPHRHPALTDCYSLERLSATDSRRRRSAAAHRPSSHARLRRRGSARRGARTFRKPQRDRRSQRLTTCTPRRIPTRSCGVRQQELVPRVPWMLRSRARRRRDSSTRREWRARRRHGGSMDAASATKSPTRRTNTCLEARARRGASPPPVRSFRIARRSCAGSAGLQQFQFDCADNRRRHRARWRPSRRLRAPRGVRAVPVRGRASGNAGASLAATR